MNKKRLAAIAAAAAIVIGSVVGPATASTASVSTASGPVAITPATDSYLYYSRDGVIYAAYGDLSQPRRVARYDANVYDLDQLKVSTSGRYVAYSLSGWQTTPQSHLLVVKDIMLDKDVYTSAKPMSAGDSLIDISPDGSQVLREVGTSFYLTNVSTGASTKLSLGAGQRPWGFTQDGQRLILSKYASNDFTITRYNIATKQTATVLKLSDTAGAIWDVSPDGTVIYDRSAGCGTPVTTWSIKTDGTGSARVATTKDAVHAASPNGALLVATRGTTARTSLCAGDAAEVNVTFSIMTRDGVVKKALSASQVEWAKPWLAIA